jgi:hypothetical protein
MYNVSTPFFLWQIICPHYKGFPASFGGVEEFVDW